MKVKQVLLQNTIGEKEVDFYVPVKIDFKENDEKNKELFYYRMFNPKSSFVEVSINSVTSKIVNITLVSVNNFKEIERSCLNIPKEDGNPIIDMSIFSEDHIITDNVNFNIYIHDKKIYILQESIAVCKQLKMKFVSLLLDKQNNISGFVFEDFSDGEWKEVKESIDSSVSIVSEV
ncbi:hypothetical protein [Holdemania massiliensis]|uniref:hypothetical protein n=1 Tax=Holdemania massiliensis TaxID=1468449 RepID=UPI001F0699F8|nr:hypothetical protein [Holdemania massiliensis]MCH1939863.1 hypothetical protein [Holdemania massiliensis]